MAENDSPKEPRRNRILTMDEILVGLSRLAEEGDGSQQTQAYRMLLSQNTAQASVGQDLTDNQLTDKLARLMKSAGPDLSRQAFVKAFPRLRKDQRPPQITAEQLGVDRMSLPTSLRGLYKMFPEVKQVGYPKGFPINRSVATKQEWVRSTALKILVDKRQQEADEAHDAAREISGVEGSGSPDAKAAPGTTAQPG